MPRGLDHALHVDARPFDLTHPQERLQRQILCILYWLVTISSRKALNNRPRLDTGNTWLIL